MESYTELILLYITQQHGYEIVSSGVFQVHVTDVEKWIKASTGSVLGLVMDALGFGVTLYLPQRREDLFPSAISGKLLSLVARKDRRDVVIVEFKLGNRAGDRVIRTAVDERETRVYLSRIK